jgi:hypothetical protein
LARTASSGSEEIDQQDEEKQYRASPEQADSLLVAVIALIRGLSLRERFGLALLSCFIPANR